MNYQKDLEEIIQKIQSQGERPSLLLHACCAPCSSYVLEYISKFFDITLYFYNPNIFPESEYEYRKEELIRLTREMPEAKEISVIAEKYDPLPFLKLSKGKERLPEGAGRCYLCYKERLFRTAEKAKSDGFDYFCTTLSISPHKNAEWINEIGQEAGEAFGVKFLPSDFKKKNGYKRSIELSRQYQLYRQAFCGCEFSKREYEKRQGKEEVRS